MKKIIILLRDLPKTVYVNFKVFNFSTACKLPLQVKYNVNIRKIYKGCMEIEEPISRFMIKLGYSGSEFISENKSSILIKNGGKIVFKKGCTIGQGFNIFIDQGIINIGENFYSNRNLLIQCEKKIFIGNNALLGWNVSIRDTDGHAIKVNDKVREYKKEIIIEDDVWVASDCTILKGSLISKQNIVACNSVVTGKKIYMNNCVIAGVPAIVKKNNVKLQW